MGKGAGKASGQQQWHCDSNEEKVKDIGEIFLCIGTADNASKVRVVNDDGDWDDIEIPPYSMFFFPWDLVHAGLDFEDDNQAFHFFIAGQKLGPKLQNDPEYLNVTADVTYDEPPKSAATTRELAQKVREFDGSALDAYKLGEEIMEHEEGKDWFSEGDQPGYDHSIHGTIGIAAFDKLVQAML